MEEHIYFRISRSFDRSATGQIILLERAILSTFVLGKFPLGLIEFRFQPIVVIIYAVSLELNLMDLSREFFIVSA